MARRLPVLHVLHTDGQKHGECERTVCRYILLCKRSVPKIHSNCAVNKTVFYSRPSKPRVDTWWFMLTIVSAYSYGNPDRSLITRQKLMTQNTPFHWRSYRAERILAVRTSNQSETWRSNGQRQCFYPDHHDQSPLTLGANQNPLCGRKQQRKYRRRVWNVFIRGKFKLSNITAKE
jgi:hypothetical protein